jgi:hypothetical protein
LGAISAAGFNPSIFQFQWVAKNIYGCAEGDQVNLVEVLTENGLAVNRLTFWEGVAFKVDMQRTEFFILDTKAETLAQLENILLKMLEILPHTPVSAIGCNFGFFDANPPERIVEFFNTPEGLEGEGVLNSRQSGCQLKISEAEVLNFSRSLSAQGIRFSFNYHRVETTIDRYKDFVPGILNRSLQHSLKLLKSLYDYEGQEVIGFVGQNEQEGNENVAKGTN